MRESCGLVLLFLLHALLTGCRPAPPSQELGGRAVVDLSSQHGAVPPAARVTAIDAMNLAAWAKEARNRHRTSDSLGHYVGIGPNAEEQVPVSPPGHTDPKIYADSTLVSTLAQTRRDESACGESGTNPKIPIVRRPP
jgi:hypothetical protein